MKDHDLEATFTPDYQTFKRYKKDELNQWLRLVEECYGVTLNFELDTTGSLLLASLSHGEATLKRMLVDLGVADTNSFYSILYSLMQIQSTSKSIVKTHITEASEPPLFKNFLQWLELSGIKKPDEDVLNRIVERYAMRCNLVANEKMARALYEDAQRYPGSTTRESIQKQLHIKLDGPLPTADTNSLEAVLLSGMNDKTKGAIVVKVLLHSDPSTQKEIDHINLLKLENQQAVGIIEAETHQVQVNRREHGMPNVSSGVFNCILMPRYVLTVAEAAGLMTEEAVYDGALRMCQALAHIHKCGLVHMDVKPANIFMDVAGNWFLGDFGSSVKQGEHVKSTSTPYLPMHCIQKPSRVEFDYFMLGVTLVTAVGVQVKDLQQDGIMLADAELVKSAAEKVQNEKLKRLIFDSISKLLHAEL